MLLSISCENDFFSNNIYAENISCEINDENLLKLNFDCSKAYLIDGYDFERADLYGSQISIIDFYDKHLDQQVEKYLEVNLNQLKSSKVILVIKFISIHINEMKFDKSFSRLVQF